MHGISYVSSYRAVFRGGAGEVALPRFDEKYKLPLMKGPSSLWGIILCLPPPPSQIFLDTALIIRKLNPSIITMKLVILYKSCRHFTSMQLHGINTCVWVHTHAACQHDMKLQSKGGICSWYMHTGRTCAYNRTPPTPTHGTADTCLK